jgi:alanine dehydrogenase
MDIGVPTEIKTAERRVGLTPNGVAELVARGHNVLVESGAGGGIGASDNAYTAAGARIADTAATVWADAELIVKVKEPQASERAQLSEGQTLFTYLHLAPDVPQTEDLLASGAVAIAYETVTDHQGRLPLLMPMSEVAGRLSVQAGARSLEAPAGGSGRLLSGATGVPPAHTVVIGGGTVGENAIAIALGMGSRVTVLDRSLAVLERLAHRFGPALATQYSTTTALEQAVQGADLVIGAVLVKGAAAPKLVTEEMVRNMKPGSVLVDVAIDQGGCFATSHPTTHDDPTFVVHDVVHYCVANMPGAVPRTSTEALTNATLPYLLRLADLGPVAALRADPHLVSGLNVFRGQLTEREVAAVQGREFVDPAEALAAV